MPDMTMCPGTGCPQRETCYRYLATPSEPVQTWNDFTKEREDSGCEFYIPDMENK